MLLQTDEATAIHTESEMQQASDAMREALKGDSAASAAVSDMEVDAALEMVCTVWVCWIGQGLFQSLKSISHLLYLLQFWL